MLTVDILSKSLFKKLPLSISKFNFFSDILIIFKLRLISWFSKKFLFSKKILIFFDNAMEDIQYLTKLKCYYLILQINFHLNFL